MPRSKNAVASRARRKRILKQAKGFYGKRKNVYTVAKNIVEKGMTYSQFINKLSVKGIEMNRKILADLAMNNPESFTALVNSVK